MRTLERPTTVPPLAIAADTRNAVGGACRLHVAVVDRESGFTVVLAKRLESAGHVCRLRATPMPASAMAAMRLDAVVIDIALLGPDSWAELDALCRCLPHRGVVVCSRGSSVADRTRGLRLGVDDWVAKPCHPQEVVARVEAVVRRCKRAASSVHVGATVVGELQIHADQFQACVAGTSAELTRREFELTQLLAECEGQVLQREEIYERVWGYAMLHGDRSVDVFVRKVRHKLERVSPGWRYIHTHFRVGYRFSPELFTRYEEVA